MRFLRGRYFLRHEPAPQTPSALPPLSTAEPPAGALLRPLRHQAQRPVTRRRSAVLGAGDIEVSAAPDWLRAIRRKLLRWYDHSARDLPWRRRSGDPYSHWVAEVMLQQTRVETVERYYDRFLQRFPDVAALAAAALDEVLSVWQGLGYYRRAENLHFAARLIVRDGWPRTAESWARLPGIGRYTAGAIASMAFGQRTPAVDGNVVRILSRLLPVLDSAGPSSLMREVESQAMRLLPRQRCGDFNQAWMDLGATVCLPREPRCDVCPLHGECNGRRLGLVDGLPGRKLRKAPVVHERIVAVLLAGDAVLLRKRPRGGRWSGLWELPNIAGTREGCREVPAAIAEALPATIQPTPAFSYQNTVAHRLSHRLYRFHIHVARVPTRSHRHPRGYCWARPAQLGILPISTAHRKVLACLRAD